MGSDAINILSADQQVEELGADKFGIVRVYFVRGVRRCITWTFLFSGRKMSYQLESLLNEVAFNLNP
jgi:hypothetical protein